MKQSTCTTRKRRPVAKCRPAVDLLDTPLPQLLDRFGVHLVDSQITDPAFVGAFIERGDGRRVLSMPSGRSWLERDTAARMLLAQGLRLDAPPVPAALEVVRA
ncbi:hypothetical protein ACFY2M_19415 [Streptomyces sp. NPDC001276]|uniref:hypothetical protein n=1 Tax=Streptomyces sp. NPDC001276 TaxID=3364555 RepID=UPI00368A086B